MSNIIYIGASIDGYIAREDGSIDWLLNLPNPEESDYGFSEFMDKIDGVIMGRKTFETVCTLDPWPYTKPVFVLSHSLQKLNGKFHDRADLKKGDIKAIIRELNDEGIINIYVDGGITIQNFLKEDLIDEMIITRIPVILGSGVPLFIPGIPELKFDHSETVIYNNMLVKTKYIRNRT